MQDTMTLLVGASIGGRAETAVRHGCWGQSSCSTTRHLGMASFLFWPFLVFRQGKTRTISRQTRIEVPIPKLSGLLFSQTTMEILIR